VFHKKSISSINTKLPREELLRRSRVLVIDDEKPEIIEDLKRSHFAVDYYPDIDSSNIDVIERPLYDLVLLDFGNVGRQFGNDEGLSLLRHIKRVNPAIIVLSYTSKALAAGHADFYRLSDGVLAKDAGISESLEKIEEGLRKAHNLQNVWMGLLTVCDVKPGSKEDKEWQDLLVRGLNREAKMNKLKSNVTKLLSSTEAQKIGMTLLTKAMELAVKSTWGHSLAEFNDIARLIALPVVDLHAIGPPHDGLLLSAPDSCRKNFDRGDACREHYKRLADVPDPTVLVQCPFGFCSRVVRTRSVTAALTGMIPYPRLGGDSERRMAKKHPDAKMRVDAITMAADAIRGSVLHFEMIEQESVQKHSMALHEIRKLNRTVKQSAERLCATSPAICP